VVCWVGAERMIVSADELLKRVLSAQGGHDSGYDTAVREMRSGRKRTCWIWWVWPTLAGVRKTSRPEFYVDADAALQWLTHPTLGPRLIDITRVATSQLNAGINPFVLFGHMEVDVDKFHESVTLFFEVARRNHLHDAASRFQEALVALGRPPHQGTLDVLHGPSSSLESHLQPSFPAVRRSSSGPTSAAPSVWTPHPGPRQPLQPPLAGDAGAGFQHEDHDVTSYKAAAASEMAALLSSLGLSKHASAMCAEGFDNVASLRTMDGDDVKEMYTVLGEHGLQRADVDRILSAANAPSSDRAPTPGDGNDRLLCTPRGERCQSKPSLSVATSTTSAPLLPQPAPTSASVGATAAVPQLSQAAFVEAVAGAVEESQSRRASYIPARAHPAACPPPDSAPRAMSPRRPSHSPARARPAASPPRDAPGPPPTRLDASSIGIVVRPDTVPTAALSFAKPPSDGAASGDMATLMLDGHASTSDERVMGECPQSFAKADRADAASASAGSSATLAASNLALAASNLAHRAVTGAPDPAAVWLQRMNAKTMECVTVGPKLKPMCSSSLNALGGETHGWACLHAVGAAATHQVAPRLLALDAEMIERRADGQRLPVRAALIMCDLPVGRTTAVSKRVLYCGLLDPSVFDPNWLDGPVAYDYKEQWVGADHAALSAAHQRGEMMPAIEFQRIVQAHFHHATYLVGHAIHSDLKTLRLHGDSLADRLIDTQALYLLPGERHARLRALVRAILPPEGWVDFQADGAVHPPDKDAEGTRITRSHPRPSAPPSPNPPTLAADAACVSAWSAVLDLVTNELQQLLFDPCRRVGTWNPPAGDAQGEELCMVLLVAESDVGRLLGKRGAKIEQLRAQSGAKLKLLSIAESQELVFGVKGSADNAKRVLRITAPDKVTVERARTLVRAAVLVPLVPLIIDAA
jgi:uncharacterized protein (DUF1810 family)